MPKLKILGTSNAVPTEKHENTHMAITGKKRLVLVDSVGTPTVRLKQAGLDPLQITDLILTHFHPDHVCGVPSLLMNTWLMGRHAPLNIYGLPHCLDRIEQLMESYEYRAWPDFFPVTYYRLPEEEKTLVLEDEDLRILASPVRHLIPTIGLRVEALPDGRVLAYSCDTEPTPAMVRLAQGADVLIHEATGLGRGHSSAGQAGEIATQAAVGCLYLIHYPTLDDGYRSLVDQARKTFSGPVSLAEDFMEIELPAR